MIHEINMDFIFVSTKTKKVVLDYLLFRLILCELISRHIIFIPRDFLPNRLQNTDIKTV